MTAPAALPPIAGYMLTGQPAVRQAAHAPIILSHDLPTEFFGIEEREASWPDYRSFCVFPITVAALARRRDLIEDDPRFDIGTDHAGWPAKPPRWALALSQACRRLHRDDDRDRGFHRDLRSGVDRRSRLRSVQADDNRFAVIRRR